MEVSEQSQKIAPIPLVIDGDKFTLEQAFTYTLISEVVRERDERMHVDIIPQWFPVTDLSAYTILGSFAWSSPASKEKWILKKGARLDAAWVTPGDRARDYLRVAGFTKKRRRVTTQQYHSLFDERRSHPLYAVPCKLENAYYIDIKSAYWTILQVIGWDVDYNPGKWLGVGRDVKDFPFAQDKPARNSLISVGLPGLLRVWDGSRLSFARRSNPFINGALWAATHDILHGIALDAVRAGALYVHTDGYIVGADKVEMVLQAIEAWGVPVGIKESGASEIRGAGDYDIGTRKSQLRRHARPAYFSNLVSHNHEWLRGKFSRWAARNLT